MGKIRWGILFLGLSQLAFAGDEISPATLQHIQILKTRVAALAEAIPKLEAIRKEHKLDKDFKPLAPKAPPLTEELLEKIADLQGEVRNMNRAKKILDRIRGEYGLDENDKPLRPSSNSTNARSANSTSTSSTSTSSSGRSNTNSQSSTQQNQSRRTTNERSYERAYQFARDPVSKGGLNHNETDARAWASSAGTLSEATLESWIDRYQLGFKFARKSVAEGGLGYNDAKARNWASNTANNLPVRDNIASWIERYQLAVSFATQPASKGGLELSDDRAVGWAAKVANQNTDDRAQQLIAEHRQRIRAAFKASAERSGPSEGCLQKFAKLFRR